MIAFVLESQKVGFSGVLIIACICWVCLLRNTNVHTCIKLVEGVGTNVWCVELDTLRMQGNAFPSQLIKLLCP